MGMDLDGAGGSLSFTHKQWQALLDLAALNGWHPAGTLPPELGPDFDADWSDWSGTYYTNDYQRVTEADAIALAEALERSLPDLPNHDAAEHKAVAIPMGRGFVLPVSAFEMFSGEDKRLVLKFIAYCRAGSFIIC